jgi:hypothetical protein
VSRTTPESEARERWLLLIHQLPPKPDYLRVKVRRRLERIGAIPLKNSVYVLPATDEASEDFEWLAREIAADGGEASVCGAEFIKGISDEALIETFRASRDTAYADIATQARGLAAARNHASEASPPSAIARHARLQRRLGEVVAIDFFGARGRVAAEEALRGAERRLEAASSAGPATSTPAAINPPRARTWVTRRDVHVDRVTSAWLIRRFIDPSARFKFVPPKGYKPLAAELRFDMYEAEFTHEGERCTFETLTARFGLHDRALRLLGEMVRDIDFKQETYRHGETSGLARLVVEVARVTDNDARRIEIVSAALDALYLALSAAGEPSVQAAPAVALREDTRTPRRTPASRGERSRRGRRNAAAK